MDESNKSTPRQLGIATNSETVFLISVENDNFAVEEYPFKEFGVKNLDGCYSFFIKDTIFFCAEKNVFGYDPQKHQKWVKTPTRLNVVRYGSASVSLKAGAIVAGGREGDGKGIPELTDSCVLLRKEKNKLLSIKLNKLPMKVRYHTMTSISNDSFIICGGKNSKGHEAKDAFIGTLVRVDQAYLESITSVERNLKYKNEEGWSVQWRKLPKMWKDRSNHFAIYANDRFYVFGGGPKRPKEQHVKELNFAICGLDMGIFAGTKAEVLGIKVEGDKVYWSNKFQMINDMAYDISFANAVLSPDQKYFVIAGGEIFGDADRKNDDTYLTMSTKNLVLRALDDKDSVYEYDSSLTNSLWKNNLTCKRLCSMSDRFLKIVE